jgi:serine/threonine protein phosphatase PrpC
VGDSRAYLLRGGGLQQLTSDHSLVAEQVRKGILTPAEAERSEMQSVLTRALGSQAQVEIDAEELGLFKGDLVLLCTDGLTRMVTEPEIAGTLQAETNPELAAAKLVALANENGGADNITALVIRLDSDFGGWFSWLRRGRKHVNGKATRFTSGSTASRWTPPVTPRCPGIHTGKQARPASTKPWYSTRKCGARCCSKPRLWASGRSLLRAG